LKPILARFLRIYKVTVDKLSQDVTKRRYSSSLATKTHAPRLLPKGLLAGLSTTSQNRPPGLNDQFFVPKRQNPAKAGFCRGQRHGADGM